MKYTIFSIDNHTRWHTVARFMRHVDELTIMQKTKGNFIQCIGSWENKLEPSFICNTEDFYNHVYPYSYCANQNSILQISECKHQYAQLVDLKTGDITPIGHLVSITKEKAMAIPSWTYRPDLNIYYTNKLLKDY